MQASLVAQIFKWFQNNECAEKLDSPNPTKRKNSPCEVIHIEDEEDECSLSEHAKELSRELQKKKFDDHKVCRLLSLTFKKRRNAMTNGKSSARIASILEEYPCFKDPRFVSCVHLAQLIACMPYEPGMYVWYFL